MPTLTIDGMTCDGCAVTVEQALLRVPGVLSASVSYEDGRALVSLDSVAPASTDNLISAVRWVGYTASLPTLPDLKSSVTSGP